MEAQHPQEPTTGPSIGTIHFFSGVADPGGKTEVEGVGPLDPPSYFSVARAWKARDIYGGN